MFVRGIRTDAEVSPSGVDHVPELLHALRADSVALVVALVVEMPEVAGGVRAEVLRQRREPRDRHSRGVFAGIVQRERVYSAPAVRKAGEVDAIAVHARRGDGLRGCDDHVVQGPLERARTARHASVEGPRAFRRGNGEEIARRLLLEFGAQHLVEHRALAELPYRIAPFAAPRDIDHHRDALARVVPAGRRKHQAAERTLALAVPIRLRAVFRGLAPELIALLLQHEARLRAAQDHRRHRRGDNRKNRSNLHCLFSLHVFSL